MAPDEVERYLAAMIGEGFPMEARLDDSGAHDIMRCTIWEYDETRRNWKPFDDDAAGFAAIRTGYDAEGPATG